MTIETPDAEPSVDPEAPPADEEWGVCPTCFAIVSGQARHAAAAHTEPEPTPEEV